MVEDKEKFVNKGKFYGRFKRAEAFRQIDSISAKARLIWSFGSEQGKLQRKTVFTSDLNFAIWEKFRANNVEIPFPQTDLHIRSGKLKVENGELAFNGDGENSENKRIKENEK